MPKAASLTEDLADRIERAMADASIARGAELEQMAGNPLAIERNTFGALQARLVGRDVAYYRYFSGPFNIRAADAPVVPALVAWYAAAQAPCYVRLSPLFADDALLHTLADVGLRQTGFMNLLYGPPRAALPLTDERVMVAEVDAATSAAFLSLWTREAPANELALRRELAAAEFRHWRRYLAFVDDRPAAYAAMCVSPGTRTAVFAAGGTLPEARGRGCHAALIGRRMHDALLAECDLVAVEASPGTQSQRNLERHGLRLAYTRVIWTPADF